MNILGDFKCLAQRHYPAADQFRTSHHGAQLGQLQQDMIVQNIFQNSKTKHTYMIELYQFFLNSLENNHIHRSLDLFAGLKERECQFNSLCI